jgi:hypothetical protein
MKSLTQLYVLVMGLLLAVSALADPGKAVAPMTLEEISALKSRSEVEDFASTRKISFLFQTNETMLAQKILAYDQSRRFGAISRLWLTFWITLGTETVSVHVSFYLDKSGSVLGRGIVIENNNNP